MKAMICRRWGGPEDLKLEEVASAPLKAGQVRLRVKAAGVSFAVTLVIAGKYQRRPPFPFAPGTEATGVVTEVGQGCRRVKGGDEGVAVCSPNRCVAWRSKAASARSALPVAPSRRSRPTSC